MARGQRDFGMYSPATTGASLSDMAELAVRQDSIVSYDQRGKVVELDDFEGTVLRWFVRTTGTGNAHLDGTYPKHDSQGVKIFEDAGLDFITQIEKFIYPLVTDRLGIEISFTKLSANGDLYITLNHFDGTAGLRAQVWYDNSADTFYILDAGGLYVPVVTLPALKVEDFAYYTLKLVADFSTSRYVRFMFSDTEYDISATSLRPYGDAGIAYLKPIIQIYSVAAGIQVVYADCFILTEDEP